MVKPIETISPQFVLTPEEEKQMDLISNALIDLIFSNPKKYLICSNEVLKNPIKCNNLEVRKKE